MEAYFAETEKPGRWIHALTSLGNPSVTINPESAVPA
jgi:hypothetical protein